MYANHVYAKKLWQLNGKPCNNNDMLYMRRRENNGRREKKSSSLPTLYSMKMAVVVYIQTEKREMTGCEENIIMKKENM